ncbi:hypothetical protein HGRIS_004425 [Hohenbuehelia grisea]|uniref:Uncharacterized protein n=1 Tax=Hohenbuehelia grisea TaxID=104357 RepID=A0ABR3JBW5_9AGAR
MALADVSKEDRGLASRQVRISCSYSIGSMDPYSSPLTSAIGICPMDSGDVQVFVVEIAVSSLLINERRYCDRTPQFNSIYPVRGKAVRFLFIDLNRLTRLGV